MTDSRTLRVALGLDLPSFARMIGVDLRSATRWELGETSPTGAAEVLLAVLWQQVEAEGPGGKTVRRIQRHAAVGEGLGALLRGLLAGRSS